MNLSTASYLLHQSALVVLEYVMTDMLVQGDQFSGNVGKFDSCQGFY